MANKYEPKKAKNNDVYLKDWAIPIVEANDEKIFDVVNKHISGANDRHAANDIDYNENKTVGATLTELSNKVANKVDKEDGKGLIEQSVANVLHGFHPLKNGVFLYKGNEYCIMDPDTAKIYAALDYDGLTLGEIGNEDSAGFGNIGINFYSADGPMASYANDRIYIPGGQGETTIEGDDIVLTNTDNYSKLRIHNAEVGIYANNAADVDYAKITKDSFVTVNPSEGTDISKGSIDLYADMKSRECHISTYGVTFENSNSNGELSIDVDTGIKLVQSNDTSDVIVTDYNNTKTHKLTEKADLSEVKEVTSEIEKLSKAVEVNEVTKTTTVDNSTWAGDRMPEYYAINYGTYKTDIVGIYAYGVSDGTQLTIVNPRGDYYYVTLTSGRDGAVNILDVLKENNSVAGEVTIYVEKAVEWYVDEEKATPVNEAVKEIPKIYEDNGNLYVKVGDATYQLTATRIS